MSSEFGTPSCGCSHKSIALDVTGDSITSCGILIKLAPFLPEVAVRIAFVITSDRDSGSCTSALYFVDDLKREALSTA